MDSKIRYVAVIGLIIIVMGFSTIAPTGASAVLFTATPSPTTTQAASAPDSPDGSGAIWTTKDDCGDIQQDVNHYEHGEWVWINGENFSPGSHPWDITGQPGGASADPGIVVASGTYTVSVGGNFCFAAYQVAYDDGGEYAVKFDVKGDNYGVDWPTPPTATATPTPGITPTQPITPTVTQTPSGTPVITLTQTVAPPTIEPPTSTPVPTEPAPSPCEGLCLVYLPSVQNNSGQPEQEPTPTPAPSPEPGGEGCTLWNWDDPGKLGEDYQWETTQVYCNTAVFLPPQVQETTVVYLFSLPAGTEFDTVLEAAGGIKIQADSKEYSSLIGTQGGWRFTINSLGGGLHAAEGWRFAAGFPKSESHRIDIR